MDERLRFVARLLDGEKMAVVCRDFGSRPTAVIRRVRQGIAREVDSGHCQLKRAIQASTASKRRLATV